MDDSVDRRRFNASERAALFVAADGLCEGCGVALEPGWHADHVQPYSKSGATDVINGAALCPTCNLKKGNRMVELRKWQRDALDHLASTSGDFLLVATPGAGKTTFALAAAKRAIGARRIERVVVVVPTAHLRQQWSNAATRFGIHLDHKFTNGVGALASDVHGTAVTYSAVSSSPALWRKLCSQLSTLVILDEIHHAGEAENLTWGPALRDAFSGARQRILLSGTPFRSDYSPIPFVTYDDSGRYVADYDYDYGRALVDGESVRPIEFLALNSEVQWRNAGSVESASLDSATDDVLAKALSSALSAAGDWIPSVLRKADDELTRQRTETPDAGGLVIASDQVSARQYARILRSVSGEEPIVAVSDDPDASAAIARFANGSARWIVAVRMVSEGVDIPRLAVGVYATNTRTEIFLRQVVGRFVRKRGPEDEASAVLFIPSIEPLLRYAKRIESTVDDAMIREVEERRREAKQAFEPQLFDITEPLGSSAAIHHSTIRASESFSDAELQRAAEAHAVAKMPSAVTFAQVAQLLRLAGAAAVVGRAVMDAPRPMPTRTDEKQALRKMVSRLVGRYHRATNEDFAHIHADLNKLCGGLVNVATIDQLERRVQILEGWIEAQS